jgi:DNA-binding LacI/PurR family transcriptional regulator
MPERSFKNSQYITSVDVAHYANVCQATVSRVLNRKGNVRKETEAKVLAAVQKLGYQPNAIARSLINRKTDIVAMIAVNSSHSFYTNIINTFSIRMSQEGKRLLYFQVKFDEDLEEIFKQIHQYQVDGMIILSASISPWITAEVERINLPMAVFNRQVYSNNVYSVCSDNIEASRMVADYLIGKGHKSFGFLGSTSIENISVDRQKGFTERLRERGFRDPRVEFGMFTYKSGWEAMERMAASGKLPGAIFSSNDLMAMGAMDFIRNRLGLSIPRDIAIIGFDAIEEGSWMSYNLTTVEQPIAKMIDTLCDYLLKKMRTGKVKEKIDLFSCRILERGTV